MSIPDEPHYEVPAAELAAWIEQFGPDCWWSVDGDPLLTGLLSIPATGDKLAALIRRIGRPLLVQDGRPNPVGKGETIGRAELNDLVRSWGDPTPEGRPRPAWRDGRVLYLCWNGSGDEWLLIEDVETTESERAEAEKLAKE
jgi:hypothetical protein